VYYSEKEQGTLSVTDETVLDFGYIISVYFTNRENVCDVQLASAASAACRSANRKEFVQKSLKSWALPYEIGVSIEWITEESIRDTVWI
jgi:hypothetical protein